MKAFLTTLAGVVLLLGSLFIFAAWIHATDQEQRIRREIIADTSDVGKLDSLTAEYGKLFTGLSGFFLIEIHDCKGLDTNYLQYKKEKEFLWKKGQDSSCYGSSAVNASTRSTATTANVNGSQPAAVSAKQ